jgi:hypothetical protein
VTEEYDNRNFGEHSGSENVASGATECIPGDPLRSIGQLVAHIAENAEAPSRVTEASWISRRARFAYAALLDIYRGLAPMFALSRVPGAGVAATAHSSGRFHDSYEFYGDIAVDLDIEWFAGGVMRLKYEIAPAVRESRLIVAFEDIASQRLLQVVALGAPGRTAQLDRRALGFDPEGVEWAVRVMM